MADETYEERLARYEAIKHDRDAGESLRTLAVAYGVSAERIRQILKVGPPMPAGYRREALAATPKTRLRERLKGRVAHWSQYDSDYARMVVALTQGEIAALDEKEMADG